METTKKVEITLKEAILLNGELYGNDNNKPFVANKYLDNKVKSDLRRLGKKVSAEVDIYNEVQQDYIKSNGKLVNGTETIVQLDEEGRTFTKEWNAYIKEMSDLQKQKVTIEVPEGLTFEKIADEKIKHDGDISILLDVMLLKEEAK